MSETKNTPLFENLVTFDELLEMLKHQYSKHTVYRWIHKQGMPYRKIKGKLWFPRDQVLIWLERS